MFIYDLPYSGEEFSIKPFTFKNQLDVSRLIYEENNGGLSKYLVDHFEIKNLNIVDKFFVLLKARQLFLGEFLSLNIDNKNINLDVKILCNSLFSIKKQHKILTYRNLFVEFDYPTDLYKKEGDILLSTIKSMKIESEYVNFDNISQKDRETLVSNLPADFIKVIREYFSEVSETFTLYEGRKKVLSSIEVDFLTLEPFYIIKNIYSEFPLYYCREIICFLSSKINSNTIMDSTPSDVKHYIEEYTRDVSGQNQISL